MKRLILINLLLFGFSFAQYGPKVFSIRGDQNSVISQDAATDAINIIDYAHHEIHSGSHYFVRGYTDMSDGDSIAFSLTTPNTTKWTHISFNINHSGVLIVKMFETATVTGGDTIAPYNNNRNSSSVSVNVVISNPTVSVEGTCIDSTKAGSDTRFSQYGGGQGRDGEIILKQNTTYLWRFISGADNNVVSWDAEWYEHTNR